MPNILVFTLPPDLIRAAGPTDPLSAIISAPIAVEAQQPIAIYVAEGKEIPGQHLSTVKWHLPAGVTAREVAGEGMTVSQGEYPVLAAAKKGFVTATEKKLKVSGVYEVSRDLNNRTGGVETPASVLVIGSISQGVTILSGGDVEVRGLIEDSSITAAGSIVAKGGFTGGEKGKLSAGKDLYCQFVQQGTLEAQGNIVVDGSIMNAASLCGKKLVVRGNGFLVGGKVMAREGVEVNRIGSEAAVVTEIEVGGNPFQLVRIEAVNNEVQKLEREVVTAAGAARHFAKQLGGLARFDEADQATSLFNAAETMRQQGASLDDEKKEELHKFGASIMSHMRLQQRLEQERKELAGAADSGGFFGKAKVTVAKIAHPGTAIKIADAVLRLDREQERVTFYYKPASGDQKYAEIAMGYI
ncbi:MAG: DUF342 domain-containing protein [Nitrospinae bacterium]|nr:DUF342 domain-containing protein [Nitrospinota bacterium]